MAIKCSGVTLADNMRIKEVLLPVEAENEVLSRNILLPRVSGRLFELSPSGLFIQLYLVGARSVAVSIEALVRARTHIHTHARTHTKSATNARDDCGDQKSCFGCINEEKH